MPIRGKLELRTRTVYLYKVYPEFTDELFGNLIIGFRAVIKDDGKYYNLPVYENSYGKYVISHDDKLYLREFEQMPK